MSDDELLQYLSFRQGTHLNYHRAAGIGIEDYDRLIPQATKFVQQDLPTSVLRTRNDNESLLELSIRQWTGYGAPQNKPEALGLWTIIASLRDDVPLSLKARAYSSLAKGWFDAAQDKGPKIMNINFLYDAGKYANELVALGLISPATLMVAARIEDIGFRRPEDNKKFPEHSTERFGQLTDLWEAFDVRKAEMAEENLRREAKVSKDPLSYSCAAEDCGIVATKKSTLWRCGGGCPLGFKPSYCSKYCQKADRKRHKPFCKPDATESSVRPANPSATATQRESGEPEDMSPERFKSGVERTIDVNLGGGRIFQLASTTMGPQKMREVRDALKELGVETLNGPS